MSQNKQLNYVELPAYNDMPVKKINIDEWLKFYVLYMTGYAGVASCSNKQIPTHIAQSSAINIIAQPNKTIKYIWAEAKLKFSNIDVDVFTRDHDKDLFHLESDGMCNSICGYCGRSKTNDEIVNRKSGSRIFDQQFISFVESANLHKLLYNLKTSQIKWLKEKLSEPLNLDDLDITKFRDPGNADILKYIIKWPCKITKKISERADQKTLENVRAILNSLE